MFRNRLMPMAVLLLLALAGCEQPQTEQTAAPAVPDSAGQTMKATEIAWFDGSVEEAFAKAETESKPLYLYWGAVWCPPCQEIKHTVFKDSQFIAQTRQFVPVYLDGDTERAQTWGEKFAVKGYPTMIIFNPAGDEVTRLPLGVDVSRYNSILALSLEQLRPTSMLVELALNAPDKLVPTDFKQLAYYSWGQDDKALPEGTDPVLFKQLADLSVETDPESSARLYLQYLVQRHQANEKAKKDEDDQTEPVLVSADKLKGILADPEMVVACWDFLSYWPETTPSLDLSDEDRQALQQQWQDAVLAQRHQPVLSTAEQLAAWLPYLEYYFDGKDETATLPEDVAASLKVDADKANKGTRNAYARQSVVNQIRYLYQRARLNDEVKALLLAELDRSASPYYFMSSLAAIAEKEEKVEEALDWRRKAYDSAEGAATRLQWGAGYIRALVRLTPEDHQTISAATLALLDEVDAADTFSGRNFRVLRSLNKDLEKWDEEQISEAGITTQLAGVRDKLTSLCDQQAADSIARENCMTLKPGTAVASGE